MWFSLFALVLILAITFYQGLLGLFSAVINCILSILAAGLAFGLYEDVYYAYLLDRQPDDGRAIALMGIFIIALLVMRVIVDQLIRENMHFPVYVDRLGGGLFGFVSAMIIIGTLSVSIQMLPFPSRWLGFSRFEMFNADTGEAISLVPKEERQKEADVLAGLDMSKVKFVRKGLWMGPDAFVIGVVSHLSDNALSGTNSLSRMNPDLLDSLFWSRFAQHGQNTTAARKVDAIRVETAWEVPKDGLYVAAATNDKTKLNLAKSSDSDDKLASGCHYVGVRAKLTQDASDDGTQYRFNPDQVRLVTKAKGGRTRAYPLMGLDAGIRDPQDRSRWALYRVPRGASVARKEPQFDFVFEVPEDEDPWYVEFRRNARAEVPALAKEAPGAGGEEKATSGAKKTGNGGKKTGSGGNSGSSVKPKPDRNRHTGADTPSGGSGDANATGNPDGTDGRVGRVARVHSDLQGSFFSDQLPFELTSYNDGGMEINGGKIIGGGQRLTARLDAAKDDEPIKGNQPPVTSFNVPKGTQLLHLSVTRLQPGSLYGQVKDFAAQNQNVFVKSADNKKIPAVGIWAIATVGQERLFELCFFDETTRMSGAAIPKLERIRRDNLKQNYELYYLFEVPAGARIKAFVNPNGREESYESANLVAPR
jgi:uncharacterized membrane protein required for colicin V production